MIRNATRETQAMMQSHRAQPGRKEQPSRSTFIGLPKKGNKPQDSKRQSVKVKDAGGV
jgi:hypothetical protein